MAEQMVWVAGFEPAAPEFRARYSNQAELHPDAFSVEAMGSAW